LRDRNDACPCRAVAGFRYMTFLPRSVVLLMCACVCLLELSTRLRLSFNAGRHNPEVASGHSFDDNPFHIRVESGPCRYCDVRQNVKKKVFYYLLFSHSFFFFCVLSSFLLLIRFLNVLKWPING